MAAGGDSDNVQINPGRLYVAALGTTEPTNNTTALPSAWRPVGYTDQGSAFSSQLTNTEVEVAEEIDPILYFLSKRTNALALAMAESTRQNLALALADPVGAMAANSNAAYEPPEIDDLGAVMLVHDTLDTPGAANVRWLFRQAKAGGNIELKRGKAPAKRLIAVTFNLERPAGLAPYKVFPNSDGLI